MRPRDDVLDHPLLGARYFFPRRDPPDAPFVVDVEGAQLVCARHAPARSRAILHFHGNGEVAHDGEELFAPVADLAEASVVFAEYRGYGGSSGAPALSAMLDDAVAIFDAAKLDPARTIVFGRSVGSIFALEVFARRGCAGLILESGIFDVEERLRLRVSPRELGVSDAAFSAAVRARLDHGAKLREHPRPVLVLHAEDDELVGVGHAHASARAAPSSTLVTFPSGGHNGIFFVNREAYTRAVVDFVARVLG